MTEGGASTVPRRQLGRMLRELRFAAGVTLDAAAVALECSRQKVWRIETGAGTVRGVDVRAMCELYGVAADLAAALVALAGETRARGWWHAYAEVPAWLGLHAGLEATARRLREYADALVPALLRTPGYARALHEPDPELTDDDRERRERAHLDRQSLLRRRLPPPPRLAVVLSEAALLRVAGDPATMAAQLAQLREVTALPHVSVRVLPLAAGLSAGAVAGSFTLLDFAPDGNRAVPELGGDGDDSLAGYRSLLHGRRPRAAGFPTTAAEVAALVEQVCEWRAQGVRPSEIAVCARFNTTLGTVRDALVAAGVPAVRIRDQPGADADAVRLATMHAMKGLEFRCVAVVGVTATAVPFAKEVTPAEVDQAQHDNDLLRERCLLFVASTRAREALHVSWNGQPSPFLADAP